MQSRIAVAARRSPWLPSLARGQGFGRGLASSSAGRTADPDVHSGEVEAGPDVYYRKNEGQGSPLDDDDSSKKETEHKPSNEAGPLKPPRTPYASSPRLESTGVNPPADPIIQQKRSYTTTSLEEFSCAGLDGTPWPKDKEKKEQRNREERVEDDREYYKHHKASPLSEIKVADTRKPITRATDGTADANEDYGRRRDVVGWLPEQLDTAEEALRRATEIWKQNAMRGDPDLPHSRVLRELRGEWF